MVNAEQPRSKNLETEINPEIVVDESTREVVERAEIQEAVDPDASHETVQKAKKYLKSGAKYSAIGGGVVALGGVFIAGKMLFGLLKFAKTAIEKKGKITFKEGYELGQDMFSFGDKKDKK